MKLSIVILLATSMTLALKFNNEKSGTNLEQVINRGYDAKIENIPYFAIIGQPKPKGKFEPLAAGAIISERSILTTLETAAHISSYLERNDHRYKVKVGTTSVFLSTEGEMLEILNASWYGGQPVNENLTNVIDIGILLVERMQLSHTVRIIPLPTRDIIMPQETCKVSGFGKDRAQSRNFYHDIVQMAETFAFPTTIDGLKAKFLRTKNHGLNVTACVDFGAPIVSQRRTELIGIGSLWTVNCNANKKPYAPYTQVYPYLGWIRKNMKTKGI